MAGQDLYYYGFPYDQSQLTEVPLKINILLQKKSKLSSNGIIKLGLSNFPTKAVPDRNRGPILSRNFPLI